MHTDLSDTMELISTVSTPSLVGGLKCEYKQNSLTPAEYSVKQSYITSVLQKTTSRRITLQRQVENFH